MLSATSVDPQEAYKDLAKCIMRFYEINVLPVPINVDKIIGDADTGYANWSLAIKHLKNQNENVKIRPRDSSCLDKQQKGKTFTYWLWKEKS